MTSKLAVPPMESAVPAASRLVALDAARGLAVLGMIVAHVGVTRDLSWGDPGSWLSIANGRSSILFATLAGISIALMSGRQHPPAGQQLVTVRLRILVRAFVLFALGGLLTALGTDISVILQTYALLFACCLQFLTWTPRRLLLLAAAWAVIAPVVTVWLTHVIPDGCERSAENCSGAQITDLAVFGDYPGVVWMTFALTGLALGRSDLSAVTVRIRMLTAGVPLMLLGYGGGWLASSRGDVNASDWAQLRTAEPHSGTTFEIAGSLGFALTVLAVLLFTADRLRPLLFPIAAVGSVPLTAYAAHIVAIWVLGDSVPESDGNALLVVFLVLTVAAATIWVSTFGRGPLERLVTGISARAVRSN